MNGFSTLQEAIETRAAGRRAVTFIEGDNVERRVKFQEMHTRASGLLHHYQERGIRAGDEIIVLVDRNEHFIDAFWAGILGNIIVVPIAPGSTDEHRAKFFRILAKLRKPGLCTDSATLARLANFAAANGLTSVLEQIAPATILLDRIEDLSKPGRIEPAGAEDIAFVQYSSGSTSEPKGVALTHKNLLTNIAGIATAAHLTTNDIALSWMPLSHDMGLIGFHLTPLVCDIEHYLMPTQLFVRRPTLWLIKATARRASILCSPNFGYRHLLKAFKTEHHAALDLSRVRILFNGAEPISAALCREFTDAMEPFGLNASAMFPVYGLAEASLAVTFPAPGSGCRTLSVTRDHLTTGVAVKIADEGDTRAATFVLVGTPVKSCEAMISDDNGRPLPAYTVGRILIRGDNVTKGYYRDSAATQAACRDGWLDTGDLGFTSPHGLAITGRAKEIIFVNGQNYYPQDIEAILEKSSALEQGKVAVCGARVADSPADALLVFVLHRGDEAAFMPVVAIVQKTVNESIGVPVDHVIPIAKMPKTTSGKIQRFRLADAYLNGEFADTLKKLHDLAGNMTVTAGAVLGEIERNLKQICDELLPDRSIGANDNIFELGTSSLTLAQIYERVEVIYPGQLEVTDFFDYPTIAELAKYLESRLAAA